MNKLKVYTLDYKNNWFYSSFLTSIYLHYHEINYFYSPTLFIINDIIYIRKL